MNKMRRILVCLCIVGLLVIPGMVMASENEMELSSDSLVLDDTYVDQKNEGGTDEVLVYGNRWFAQTIEPNADSIPALSIYIGKRDSLTDDTQDENNGLMRDSVFDQFPFFQLFFPLFQRIREYVKTAFLRPRANPADLGELTIALYTTYGSNLRIPDEPLRSVSFSPSDIEDEAGWVKFDFGDNPISIEDEPFDNSYCIVVYASGGDEKHYYKWMCSTDRYKEGYSHSSMDGGVSWETDRQRDFCFRSYGWDYSEDPDGIVNRWGIFMYDPDSGYSTNDCNAFKNVLISNPEWMSSHIYIYDYDEERDSAEYRLLKFDKYEDEDDIVIFYYKGHTANLRWLDEWFDRFGSKSIAIISDMCYAAQADGYLGENGREILASSMSSEESRWCSDLSGGVFSYYIFQGLGGAAIDKNHDGWLSTREVFDYASPKTTGYVRSHTDTDQHPQFFDYIPEYDIPLVSTT